MSNEQNLHVKITGDTSDISKEVDAVARQLVDIENKVTASNKIARKTSSTLKETASSVESTRNVTAELGNTMAHTAEQTGDAARGMQDLKQKALDLSEAFVSTKQNAEKFSGVIDAIVKGMGTGGASGVMANLRTLANSAAFQVALLQKVLKSLGETAIKAITIVHNTWKDASDLAQNFADLTAEGASSTDKVAEKTEKYMKRLGELLRTEKLSNVEKMEMSDLLGRLDGGFTHVGKSISKARGNLKQYDKDMAAFLDRDKHRKLESIDAQIGALHNALAEEKKIIGLFENQFFAGLTNGLTAKFATDARTREMQIQKKINGLLAERNELEESNPGNDYRRRRAAEDADKKAEQLKKMQDVRKDARKAMSEASDELDLSDYDRKRKAAMKKYADMARDLKGDPRAMANIARLRAKELAKIDKEESDKRAGEAKKQTDAEKAAEKSVHDAKKAFWDAEKNMRKAVADARVAQARKVADAEIRQLERVRKRIDRRKGRFGFTLDVNPDEKPSQARQRRKRNAIDSSIADKQQRQREGERVHYTRRERARIGQYRDLQKQGKQVDARLKELEAAKKQQEAAAQAKAAAERVSEAAKRQREAALKLQEAAKAALKAIKGENPERSQPNRLPRQRQPAMPGRRPVVRPQQRNPSMVQRPIMPVASSAARFTPNYTPYLAAILTAVNRLKSNTYIVR